MSNTGITIGESRFVLSGVGATDEFLPSFSEFLCSDNHYTLDSRFDIFGSDSALENTKADPSLRWTFTENADTCVVKYCDITGCYRWILTGTPDFSHIELRYHPTLFPLKNVNIPWAWNRAIGFISLGMRLRFNAGLLFHGASIKINNGVIFCTGVSGAGKSTISQLLHDSGAKVLSDERTVVRGYHSNNTMCFRAFGTPWPSSAGFAANDSGSLRRIYFLKHGPHNRITPLSPAEAVRRLIPVTMIPWKSHQVLDPFLATLEQLVEKVPAALLEFRPDQEVVECLHNDLAKCREF